MCLTNNRNNDSRIEKTSASVDAVCRLFKAAHVELIGAS